MNFDYSKRGGLLPKGCKDLGDVLKLEALKTKKIRQPWHTNEEIREVFRRYVPEFAAGTVEIVSIARNVGRRCLLVVRSHDPQVSGVEAFSFKRGERLSALVAELGGEHPSVIEWRASAEELIRAAFGGLETVALDSGTRQATVTIHPLSRNQVVVAKEDQIVRMLSELAGLVSEVTGWKIRLVGEGNA